MHPQSPQLSAHAWHVFPPFWTELHPTGMLLVAEQVRVAWERHWLFSLEIMATFPMPPPNMVSRTRAATRITTAVITMTKVSESAFIDYIFISGNLIIPAANYYIITKRENS